MIERNLRSYTKSTGEPQRVRSISAPPVGRGAPARMEERHQSLPIGAQSRRHFIRAIAAGAGAAVWSRAHASGDPSNADAPSDGFRPIVARARSSHAIRGTSVHPLVLREMLGESLIALTGTASVVAAWRSILKPDDVIGIKFNRSGQDGLGTTETFASELIASITSAGWSRERIVCIEAPRGLDRHLGTQPARIGFDEHPTDFGSGSDQFASVLNQITALICVPFLKTHNVAGMTCCLKNLSHGLVKHPARYHGGGCAPYIGDIVSSAPIKSKLRLCIVDALRVVFEGGPEASAGFTGDAGVVLAGTDPVACDAIGLTVLNQVRADKGLAPLAATAAELPYLAAAAQRGLGTAARHAIEVAEIHR